MRIDQTKCDRCGFVQANPAAFIGPATVKMRRPSEQFSAVDVTMDLCVACFDSVQSEIIVAMAAK